MEAPSKRNKVCGLIDHVVVEIFRHLPARSLCCCKCVCRSWNRLISDSNIHKVLPQTVADFFYRDSWSGVRHFTSVTGECYSLSFFPFRIDNVAVSDSCNDLVLCCCVGVARFCYVVCNPVTKKWLQLLPSSSSDGGARMAFDGTISSHFHVTQYVQEYGSCDGVEIYSSKTIAWIYKEPEWGQHIAICQRSRSVFLNGYLHIIGFIEELYLVLAVDMAGKTWRTISIPFGRLPSIQESQGHLCVCTIIGKSGRNESQLAVWIHEDYGTDKWKMEHSVSTLKVFRRPNITFGFQNFDSDYIPIIVHPEWK